MGLTVVPEGTVCGNVDALLFGVRDELLLRKQWVGFNLVDGLWNVFLELSLESISRWRLTGTTPVAPIRASICSTVKLETPTARTFPATVRFTSHFP